MKRIVLLSLFLTGIIVSALSQNEKSDYVWLLGYGSNPDTSFFGGSKIDFNFTTPNISYEFRNMNFDITNANISDENGQILFYTNGIYIANALDSVMENGDGLNPDFFTNGWVDQGYPLTQGAIILSHPDSSNIFYLIHEEYTGANFEGHLVLIPHIMYTTIDMNLGNGFGAVIQKNEIILTDTLDYGKITSTKHANGIDWWILVPEFESAAYYRLLLTAQGIEVVGKQSVGSKVLSGVGQAVFSPDGLKYARINTVSVDEGGSLDLYDFDRCTGLLSNHTHIFYPQNFGAGGVAISPNSRFVYASKNLEVLQYDLLATDIATSVDTVAVYDGFGDPLPTTFFMNQLAPDGKIYISSPATVNTLHVINFPDLPGDSCEVIQHGIQLPTLNKFSLPNFPNYRLGALDGSCSPLEGERVISNVLCHGDSTGSIALVPIGGAYPYTYLWNDTLLNGGTLEGLPAGNYTVTLTDAFDSTWVSTIEVTQPEEITLQTENTPETSGQGDGTATVIPSGGTPPYSFEWNTLPPQDSAMVFGLTTGTYEVTVTDAQFCSQTTLVEVGQVVSVTSLRSEYPITIYPNPTSSEITIDFPFQRSDDWTLLIYNTLGNELLERVITKTIQKEKVSMDGFLPGIYFLYLRNQSGQKIVEKVIFSPAARYKAE